MVIGANLKDFDVSTGFVIPANTFANPLETPFNIDRNFYLT